VIAAEAALFFESQGDKASFLWFRVLEGGAPFTEQLGQRVAILPVILFLVVGLVMLLGVNEKRARQRGRVRAGFQLNTVRPQSGALDNADKVSLTNLQHALAGKGLMGVCQFLLIQLDRILVDQAPGLAAAIC